MSVYSKDINFIITTYYPLPQEANYLPCVATCDTKEQDPGGWVIYDSRPATLHFRLYLGQMSSQSGLIWSIGWLYKSLIQFLPKTYPFTLSTTVILGHKT